MSTDETNMYNNLYDFMNVLLTNPTDVFFFIFIFIFYINSYLLRVYSNNF